LPTCPPAACLSGVVVSDNAHFGSLSDQSHVNRLATRLWSART
jgi:hypothetical protein